MCHTYVSVLSGLIQLISDGCQVGLQRVVVVSQPVDLTLLVFLSLLAFVLLVLQRLQLKVAFVDVLQQSLNLNIIDNSSTSALLTTTCIYPCKEWMKCIMAVLGAAPR